MDSAIELAFKDYEVIELQCSNVLGLGQEHTNNMTDGH